MPQSMNSNNLNLVGFMMVSYPCSHEGCRLLTFSWKLRMSLGEQALLMIPAEKAYGMQGCAGLT